ARAGQVPGRASAGSCGAERADLGVPAAGKCSIRRGQRPPAAVPPGTSWLARALASTGQVKEARGLLSRLRPDQGEPPQAGLGVLPADRARTAQGRPLDRAQLAPYGEMQPETALFARTGGVPRLRAMATASD